VCLDLLSLFMFKAEQKGEEGREGGKVLGREKE